MIHHLRLNNLNIPFLRRAAIGVALGIIIIIFIESLGLMDEGDHSSSPVIAYNTATVTLPTVEAPALPNHHDHTPITTNAGEQLHQDNAERYKNFARHKSQLTQAQLAAIKNDSPRLTVVLSNIGQQQSQIELITVKLPKSVTVSLSPYARQHNEIIRQLKEFGFETWMDIATLERSTNHDWGNQGLSPSYNFDRNIKLLSMQMAQKDNITGVILPQNSLLQESSQLWPDITQDLFADGYGVLDNTTGIIKPALFFFDNNRAPYIKGDIELNPSMTKDEMKLALEAIRKQILEQKNMIITIPFSTPATLDILAQWLNSLDTDGITLVPLSAQAKL